MRAPLPQCAEGQMFLHNPDEEISCIDQDKCEGDGIIVVIDHLNALKHGDHSPIMKCMCEEGYLNTETYQCEDKDDWECEEGYTRALSSRKCVKECEAPFGFEGCLVCDPVHHTKEERTEALKRYDIDDREFMDFREYFINTEHNTFQHHFTCIQCEAGYSMTEDGECRRVK